jgi:hypothetical protein
MASESVTVAEGPNVGGGASPGPGSGGGVPTVVVSPGSICGRIQANPLKLLRVVRAIWLRYRGMRITSNYCTSCLMLTVTFASILWFDVKVPDDHKQVYTSFTL